MCHIYKIIIDHCNFPKIINLYIHSDKLQIDEGSNKYLICPETLNQRTVL